VYVVDLCLALRGAGVEPVIYTLDMARAPGAPHERATRGDLATGADELDVRMFRTRKPHRLGFSPELAIALRRDTRTFDAVHIHNLFLWPQYRGGVEARRAGLPYVVTPHGAFDPFVRRRGQLRKRLTDIAWQRRLLERASVIHATSQDELDHMRDIAPHVPRALVQNGVYSERFEHLPPRGAFRERHLAGFDGPVVMFLGRIAPKKGLDILIRAFAQVRAKTDARLAIVGPDDEDLSPTLRSVAAEAGVADEVAFTGPLYEQDRLSALADADLWALSSHAENFGIAVVEAMAAGLPVVVSREVDIAAEIDAAGAGICSDLSVDDFAGHLIRLIDDPQLRAQIAQRGRDYAKRYDWHAIASEMAQVYEKALGRPAPNGALLQGIRR
jgi:glycosyltransferase involved in cell wall biosynthesis